MASVIEKRDKALSNIICQIREDTDEYDDIMDPIEREEEIELVRDHQR